VGLLNKGVCTLRNVNRTTKSNPPTTTTTNDQLDDNNSNIDFAASSIDLLSDLDNEKMLRELEDFSKQLLSPEGIEEIFETVDELEGGNPSENGKRAGLNIMLDGQEIRVEISPSCEDFDEGETNTISVTKSTQGLSLPVLEPEFHFLNMPSSPNFYSPTIKTQEDKSTLLEFNPEHENLLEFNSLLELKQFENNTFGFSDDQNAQNDEDDLELSEADQFFTELSYNL